MRVPPFFQIGVNVIPANYSILQAIWDGGHQIALHTNTHPDLNLMTEAQILDEVTKTIDALKASPLGIEPNYVRPPFGNENANAKMVMDSLGLTTVVWSVDSNDWRYADNVAGQAEIVSNILGPVKANDVILAHDIHEFSVDKMDEVIRGLVEKGFILETIGNCKSNAKPYYRNKPNNLPNKSITASYIPAGKGDPSSVKVSGQSAQTASSAFTDRIGGNVVATAALLAALVGGIMTI